MAVVLTLKRSRHLSRRETLFPGWSHGFPSECLCKYIKTNVPSHCICYVSEVLFFWWWWGGGLFMTLLFLIFYFCAPFCSDSCSKGMYAYNALFNLCSII